MLSVKIYPDLYSPHITQVYSGLYDLEKNGKIILNVTSNFDKNLKKARRNSVLCVQVSDSRTGATRTVCFDMFDGREISSIERLRLCDVYVKRSYCRGYITGLDAADGRKIIPYGLNYECRSRNEHAMVKRLLIYHLASNTIRTNPFAFARHFSTEVVKYCFLKYGITKFGFKPMSVEDFVVSPEEPVEQKILFQTRLWTMQECPRISERKLQEINDRRVDTVRALRKSFGAQFVGGLVGTDIARRHYPDYCLREEDTNRAHYMTLVRRCLICVTTSGLHDSIGFKLPEYLAASRCIVTEPLTYELPVSLQEGKNYLSFCTPDECVKACQRIMVDSDLANQMRRENHKYYLKEVEPAALVYKCLRRAMAV